MQISSNVAIMLVTNLIVIGGLLLFSEMTFHRSSQSQLVVRRVHNPLSFIVLLYFLSAVAAFFVDPNSLPDFHPKEYKSIYFAIYTISIAATLAPCIILKRFKLEQKAIRATSTLTLFLYIASLLGLYSFFYQLPYAYDGIATGAALVREMLNVQGVYILPNSIFTTLAVGVSSFYPIFLIGWFLCLTNRLGKFLSFSMFLGSLSYIISLLTFQGRSGFVLYLIIFYVLYLTFKPILAHHLRLKIKNIIKIFLIIAFLGFFIITIQRFWIHQDASFLWYGTIGYIGQQPFVFAESLYRSGNFLGLNYRFPVLNLLLGGQLTLVERTIPYQWMFGTFIEDFYMTGGGPWLIFGVVSIVSVFSYYAFRYRHSKNYAFLIIYILYAEFMGGGVFYFTLGTWAGNMHIVFMFLLFYLARIMLKYNSNPSHVVFSKS